MEEQRTLAKSVGGGVKVVRRSVDGRTVLFESVEAFWVPREEWQATQEAAALDKVLGAKNVARDRCGARGRMAFFDAWVVADREANVHGQLAHGQSGFLLCSDRFRNSKVSVMSSSANEIFMLEEPLVPGADHFLCPTEEREEREESDDEDGISAPNSGYLGDLLRAGAEATESVATVFESGILTRSVTSPCIFYWKGALNTLSFSTDGLFRIVSGPHPSSSDFSELFAGVVLSAIHGKVGIVGIDKTLPRAMRTATNQASGVPDLYCVQKHGPESAKFIISVKRFYIHDDRIDRLRLAHAILNKAFCGLEEYLKIIPLPGDPIVIVLASTSADAHLIAAVHQRKFGEDQKKFGLYVIVIGERGDLYRMIFRYTLEDAETIKEMFNERGEKNRDFVTIADVPWLGQNAWFANPPEEEEDFEYVDLMDVFGDGFLGGGGGL